MEDTVLTESKYACPKCGRSLDESDMEANDYACTRCGEDLWLNMKKVN